MTEYFLGILSLRKPRFPFDNHHKQSCVCSSFTSAYIHTLVWFIIMEFDTVFIQTVQYLFIIFCTEYERVNWTAQVSLTPLTSLVNHRNHNDHSYFSRLLPISSHLVAGNMRGNYISLFTHVLQKVAGVRFSGMIVFVSIRFLPDYHIISNSL